MSDEQDDDVRAVRKFLEERANQLIERLQETRTSTNEDLQNCKTFVLEQLESTRKKIEVSTDHTIQEALMELLSTLERIDGLIGEIETCKSTVGKLNSLLLREDRTQSIKDT